MIKVFCYKTVIFYLLLSCKQLNYLYISQMVEAVNIQELLKSELVGCNPLAIQLGNYQNLFESLSVRIRLVHNKETAKKVTEFIIQKSKLCNEVSTEYTLNQMQWAIRMAIHPSYEREKNILNAWIAKVMAEKGQDYALDFMKKVMDHRVEYLMKSF